jgi:hypothetical protein
MKTLADLRRHVHRLSQYAERTVRRTKRYEVQERSRGRAAAYANVVELLDIVIQDGKRRNDN